MPELPDVELYVKHLIRRCVGQRLERVELVSPFVLRSVEPPVGALEGRELLDVSRMGKRLVFDFGDELYAVIHLMIAGRLQWLAPGATLNRRRTLLGLHWPDGIVQLTEAGTKRRARFHVVAGDEALEEHDPGGVEPLRMSVATFAERAQDWQSYWLDELLEADEDFFAQGCGW